MEKKCKICGGPLNRGKIYCSNKCYGIDRRGKPSGSLGYKHTEEFKEKLSKRMSGENNIAKRPEVRKKISEALAGRKLPKEHVENCKKGGAGFKNGHIPWNKGKKLPEMSKKRMGKNNPSWNGGTSFGKYSHKFNDKLKDRVRKRDNNQCFVCGKNQEKYGKCLSVHHIDNDKYNNKMNNLVTLCNSCHGKTRNDREKWRKYFNERI